MSDAVIGSGIEVRSATAVGLGEGDDGGVVIGWEANRRSHCTFVEVGGQFGEIDATDNVIVIAIS